MTALDDEVRRLTEDGELDLLADALTRRAAERLGAHRFAEAARDLADSATLHRVAGRPYDEARVTIAQATALRAGGELDEAIECAEQARELAPEATPLRVSVETELAESRLLQGRTADAVAGYRRALAQGERCGLLPVAQAALYRRIAFASSIGGDHEAAAHAAGEAAARYAESGKAADARRTRIEAATALVAAGMSSAAGKAIASVRDDAAGDESVLADLELLESAQALAAGDATAALGHARAARIHALAGDAVIVYAGAQMAIAELLDRAGDRAGAYDALAVGWVTTGERIGEAAAAGLFRPKLTELRTRWGVAAFDAVKDVYYATRARS